MATIEVDFDVFKELTMRRKSESDTENDIIRELLGLNHSPQNFEAKPKLSESGVIDWVCKGVTFPHGTEFRATHKGQQFFGHVDNGCLLVNGNRFTSPSAAAVAITGNSVNGWIFWECLLPGTSRWKMIKKLRN